MTRFGRDLFKVNARLQINGLPSQNADLFRKSISFGLNDRYNTYLLKHIQYLTKTQACKYFSLRGCNLPGQGHVLAWQAANLFGQKNVWQVKLIIVQSINRWIEYIPYKAKVLSWLMFITEGLPGVLGNKGTKGKYRREQGNMNTCFRERGNKNSIQYKLEDQNVLIKRTERALFPRFDLWSWRSLMHHCHLFKSICNKTLNKTLVVRIIILSWESGKKIHQRNAGVTQARQYF